MVRARALSSAGVNHTPCQPQEIPKCPIPPPCVCNNDDASHILSLRNAAASPFKTLATHLATTAYMHQDSDEDDEKPQAMFFPEDLTEKNDFDPTTHEVTWKVCVLKTDQKGKEYISPTEYLCSNDPRNEQSYQLQWYGSHVRKKSSLSLHPPFVKCIQLPPEDYKFPIKYPVIPAMSDAVHWPNLRAANRSELIVFNKNTPKNLYHFNAPAYDAEALNDLKIAARYIPFGKRVRTMLDVGAGGGSMGVLVRRKYDIQTVSTIFADWPYCEYITERGNPCLLSDSMESLPFAKFSFDLVHISWVYHGQQPEDIVTFLREANRVTRPGGYIWLYDGWSKVQVDAIELTAKKFGWHLLHEYRREIEPEVSKRISFGKNLPYQWEWRTIFVKPIRYEKISGGECEWTSGLTTNFTGPFEEEDEPFPPLPGQAVEKKPKPKPTKITKLNAKVDIKKEISKDDGDDQDDEPENGKKPDAKKPNKSGAKPAKPAPAAPAAAGKEEEEEEDETPAAPAAPAAPAVPAPAADKKKKSKKAPVPAVPAAQAQAAVPPAPGGEEEEEEEEDDTPQTPTTPPTQPAKKKKKKKVQAMAETIAAGKAAEAPAPPAPQKKNKKKKAAPPQIQIVADQQQPAGAQEEQQVGMAGAGPPARPHQPGDQ